MILNNPRVFFISALWLAGAVHSVCYADVKAGETLTKKGTTAVPPCMQCHGSNGEGLPAAGYPRLAGQSQAYLVKQLQDFKARRTDPVMQPFAKALSVQQISDVAAYYASLPALRGGKPSSPQASPAAPAALGLQLAQKGNWDKGIPACFACHGEQGAGIAPSFPALAGQNAAYTVKQLKAWKTGARANDPQGLMKAVADKMSAEEIAAAGAYLEGMK